MTSASFADKPTIDGERVILCPMTAADALPLYESMDDEARRMTGAHRSFTFDEILAWTESRRHATDRLDLSIIERSTGAWIGELAILDWDEPNQSCAFRIALAPAARNRGFGSEATRLIVDYVFEYLPINRIGLDVFDFNARAIHIYERVGFVREGVCRSCLYWDGQFYDAILMSILRDEWLARRSSQGG